MMGHYLVKDDAPAVADDTEDGKSLLSIT